MLILKKNHVVYLRSSFKFGRIITTIIIRFYWNSTKVSMLVNNKFLVSIIKDL